MPTYPTINSTSFGEVTLDDKTYSRDLYIFADGTIRVRDRSLAEQAYGSSHRIGPVELEQLLEGQPKVIFIGMGQYGVAILTDEGRQFLRESGITFKTAPTPKLIEIYNSCDKPKAALIHITC